MSTRADRNCQPVRLEPDQGSGYSFELDHVYPGGAGGTVTRLDERSSYWRVIDTRTGSSKSLTYAMAMAQRPGKLSFVHFSDLDRMRDELIALLA